MSEQPTTGTAGDLVGSGGLVPYLAVPDTRAAVAWYAAVFGARQDGELFVMPDGRVGHGEVVVGGGRLMLSDESPEIGLRAPDGTSTSVTLHLEVDDVDGLVARAAEHGGAVERAPEDAPYGRNAVIRDPFGHRWLLLRPAWGPANESAPASAEPTAEHTIAAAAPQSRPGDVVYLTHETPDSARARAFYGAVLGWTFTPGSVEDAWRLEGVRPMTGMWGGHGPALTPMYLVDDIQSAVERVRAAGGTATDPAQQPYGWSAECTDDQGVRFYLGA